MASRQSRKSYLGDKSGFNFVSAPLTLWVNSHDLPVCHCSFVVIRSKTNSSLPWDPFRQKQYRNNKPTSVASPTKAHFRSAGQEKLEYKDFRNLESQTVEMITLHLKAICVITALTEDHTKNNLTVYHYTHVSLQGLSRSRPTLIT